MSFPIRLGLAMACAFLMYSPSLHAAEVCRFQSWSELIERVTKASGDLALYADKKAAVSAERDLAALRPSSRVTGDFYQDTGRWDNAELEASYLFVWEQKAKREARLRRSDAEESMLDASRQLKIAEIKLRLALGLHRIEQIDEEKDALRESSETYRRLSKRLENLPALSPEQQLTLAVFRMAEDESQVKLATLEAELIPLLNYQEEVTACEKIERSFPLLALESPHSPAGKGPAAEALVLEQERVLALAEENMARLSEEVDVEWGPIVRLNRQDEKQRFEAGLSISLPLNSARKDARAVEASAQRKLATATIDWRIKRLELDKRRWQKQWDIGVRELKKRWDLKDIQKRHRSMEELFASGRITASLIIEGHRQILDSLKSRHSLESMSVEARAQLLLLSGEIMEAAL